MTLSDRTVDRLRELCVVPDLTGTKYRLIGEIGRGGMGTVYAAEDNELERRVALKVIDMADSAEAIREARILAQLEHPGIVPVHDAGTLPDGRVFYAMKLVQGARLDEWSRKVTSLHDALNIFRKVCQAVAFAHAHGVVHCDLKPENIIVGPFGEALVMDWGIARHFRDRSADDSGLVIGTACYMPPEQARGELSRIDGRSDVYSLGAILDFLVGPSGPRPLRAVCRRAMSAEPSARYETALALENEISAFLERRPVDAYRESLAERAARWISRHRVACILVGTYLILRVLFIFFTSN
jgi:serine/threonine-protein kinase